MNKMEKQQIQFTPLSFKTNTAARVQKQRKILEFYAKQDQEKLRRNKGELFSLQNIQGLASVLEMTLGVLQFVYEDQFITQLTAFFQGAKRHALSTGDKIKLEEGNFLVLVDGSLVKKSQFARLNTIQVSLCKAIKKQRTSNKQSPKKTRESNLITSIPLAQLIGKNASKNIQANFQTAPKMINYDPTDNKPFTCAIPAICLEFSELSLQKLQNWIRVREKQILINFLSECLGVIDDRKTLSKLASKLNKQKIEGKSQITVEAETAYLIYKGIILLQCQSYQIQLNKNSIIYKNSQNDFCRALSITSPSIIFAISLSQILEVSEPNESIREIQNRLKNLNCDRKKLFEQKATELSSDELVEPVFRTQILNIKEFQKNSYGNSEEKYRKIEKSLLFKPKPRSSEQSKRLRITKQLTGQITLPADLSIFLSNYPYIKIVESEEKAENILKMSASPKYRSQKSSAERQRTQIQKKKIQKQIKKLYYNDKVRKLKIRNIAQKQIPNGHRKKLDSSKAEKQISQYLLFKNMIEYPMNGISQNATKEARNNKIIQKIVKMSSMKSNINKLCAQQKRSENTFQFLSTDRFMKSDSLAQFSQTSTQLKGSRQHYQQRTTTLENEYLKSINSPSMCSFYCKNILTPHLKAQKQLKQKKPKQIQFSDQPQLNSNQKIKTEEKKENIQYPQQHRKECLVDKILAKSNKNLMDFSNRMKTIV